MLVLTRKHNQKVVIGHKGKEITITILKIQNGEKVSIGIEADPDTPIFREELLMRSGVKNDAKRLSDTVRRSKGHAMARAAMQLDDPSICNGKEQ